jgi:hypothetical protein
MYMAFRRGATIVQKIRIDSLGSPASSTELGRGRHAAVPDRLGP